MVKAIRTFADRVAEVISKQSPFSSIEEYTEWYLSLMAIDLSKDGVLLEQSYRKYISPFREVPLDTLKHKTVDIIAVVDSHIDDFGYWLSFDAEQLLVRGQELEHGYDIVVYKQGYARAN